MIAFWDIRTTILGYGPSWSCLCNFSASKCDIFWWSFPILAFADNAHFIWHVWFFSRGFSDFSVSLSFFNFFEFFQLSSASSFTSVLCFLCLFLVVLGFSWLLVLFFRFLRQFGFFGYLPRFLVLYDGLFFDFTRFWFTMVFGSMRKSFIYHMSGGTMF